MITFDIETFEGMMNMHGVSDNVRNDLIRMVTSLSSYGNPNTAKQIKNSLKLFNNSMYGELTHNANNFDFASLYPNVIRSSDTLTSLYDEMNEHNALNENN